MAMKNLKVSEEVHRDIAVASAQRGVPIYRLVEDLWNQSRRAQPDVEVDPWEPLVLGLFEREGGRAFSINEILQKAVGQPRERATEADRWRIGRILQRHGMRRAEGGTQWA